MGCTRQRPRVTPTAHHSAGRQRRGDSMVCGSFSANSLLHKYVRGFLPGEKKRIDFRATLWELRSIRALSRAPGGRSRNIRTGRGKAPRAGGSHNQMRTSAQRNLHATSSETKLSHFEPVVFRAQQSPDRFFARRHALPLLLWAQICKNK
jgi:hypothetical protein